MTLTTTTDDQQPTGSGALLRRSYVKHEPKWQRFQTAMTDLPGNSGGKLKTEGQKEQQAAPHPYQRQYAHVYHQRQSVLGPQCWKNPDLPPSSSTSAVQHVERILDLKDGVPCVAVGTLVCERGEDGDDKKDSQTLLHPDSECRSTDALYLEDESGRVALQCDKPYSYPMGIVVAVQGVVGADGVMQVETVYPPRPELHEIKPSPDASTALPANNNKGNDSPCLLLISGLNCGDATVPSLPRDMLLSYLEGRLGESSSAARVGQVIVAGGLLAPLKESTAESSLNAAEVAAAKKVQTSDRLAALQDVDGWILNVAAAGVPIDIVPGQHDPTTANWPQRPLHRSLLPQSNRYFSSAGHSGGLIHRTPNPFAAKLHGKDVVGTDGTNIADLKKRVLRDICNNGDNNDGGGGGDDDADSKDGKKGVGPITELDSLRMTLQYSHLAPTGPDTIPTAPHSEMDPMVLSSDNNDNNQLPDLYFCGNANTFATTLVGCNDDSSNQCRLVCVPQFSTTGQAVLVHLASPDMKVEILRFLPE